VIDGDLVVHEVRYAHPVQAVRRALISRAELAAWLMPNDFAAEPGRRFRLDARPGLASAGPGSWRPGPDGMLG
jgi:uncharacterized protein YndB with AHSA1/START domain